jgi:tetratricopeptide (TPR) repeat protein
MEGNQLVAAFEAAIEEDPNNVYARFNLAGLFAAQGLHDRALAHLDRVTALVPGYEGGAAWYNRGRSLLALARYIEAASSFDRVLKMPYTGRCSHAAAMISKASALEKLGRREEARSARTHAEELANREGREWMEEGNIHASARQYAEAIASYDRSAAHVWRGRAVALLNRALCRKQLGRFHEALADLQAAQVGITSVPPAELGRALVFSAGQGPGEVPRIIDRLLQVMVAALERYNRAFVRARLGHLDGAAEDLKQALSLAPELREEARGEADFIPLRQDPTFADLWAGGGTGTLR